MGWRKFIITNEDSAFLWDYVAKDKPGMEHKLQDLLYRDLIRSIIHEWVAARLTTGSTVTAAPVDLAANNVDLAQPQVNPDR